MGPAVAREQGPPAAPSPGAPHRCHSVNFRLTTGRRAARLHPSPRRTVRTGPVVCAPLPAAGRRRAPRASHTRTGSAGRGRRISGGWPPNRREAVPGRRCPGPSGRREAPGTPRPSRTAGAFGRPPQDGVRQAAFAASPSAVAAGSAPSTSVPATAATRAARPAEGDRTRDVPAVGVDAGVRGQVSSRSGRSGSPASGQGAGLTGTRPLPTGFGRESAPWKGRPGPQ